MQCLAISKCCQSGHSDKEKNTVMSHYSSSLMKFTKIVFQPKTFIQPIQYFFMNLYNDLIIYNDQTLTYNFKLALNFYIKVQYITETSDNATSLFFPPVINLKRIDCRELFQSALGTIAY